MSAGVGGGAFSKAWHKIRQGRWAQSPEMHVAAEIPPTAQGEVTVNEERERILRIHDEGRISAQEADDLLRAIGEPPLTSTAPEPPVEPEQSAGGPEEERLGAPPPPEAPPRPQPSSQEAWKALEEQLRSLGRTVSEVVRAGFQSTSWRDFEGSLNRLGEDLSDAVDQAVDSGQVDQIRQQAAQLAQLAAAAVEQTMEEVQPQVDAALRQASDELQRVVQRLEAKPVVDSGPSESAADTVSEERKRILRMVEEHQIGAEEADQLLAALGQKSAPAWGRRGRSSSGGRRRINLGGLTGANLMGAKLEGAKIGGADFEGAVLQGANLQAADLTGADLEGAVLSEATLQGADLRQADLTGAVLGGANLQGANLRNADLTGAVLPRVNLQGANLENTDLSGAMIEEGANLQGLDLSGLDLSATQLTEESIRQMLATQDEG